MWNLKIQQTSDYNKKEDRFVDLEYEQVLTSMGEGALLGLREWDV